VQALPSLQSSTPPPAHRPPWQVSSPLQTSVSAHDVPSATATFWQPVAGRQPSVVHGLRSLQSRTVPAVHTPDRQDSSPLHAFPSLHAVPSDTVATWQPRSRSQVSDVHGLPSSHVGAVPGEHTPDRQVSTPSHAFPSLHGVPFGTGLCWQPAAGRQLSVVHGLLSSQSGAVPAAHEPAWQISSPLHASPSLQGVPFGRMLN
jgi:hypothetical protein